MSVEVYMIENTADGTFWTQQGFKKEHGQLFRTDKWEQKQIDSGKLAMFISHGFGIKARDVKIGKFKLERIDA